MSKHIGRAIAYAREHAHMTPSELAKKAGIAVSTIPGIEGGLQEPSSLSDLSVSGAQFPHKFGGALFSGLEIA